MHKTGKPLKDYDQLGLHMLRHYHLLRWFLHQVVRDPKEVARLLISHTLMALEGQRKIHVELTAKYLEPQVGHSNVWLHY